MDYTVNINRQKNAEFEFSIANTEDYIEFTIPETPDETLKELNLAEGFVTHDSPPKGYPKTKTSYGDPKNFKYPLNNESRVRAAWSYINMPKNQKGYSSSQIASIKSRIKRAGQKYGIKFND